MDIVQRFGIGDNLRLGCAIWLARSPISSLLKFDDCDVRSRGHDLKTLRIEAQIAIDVAELECGKFQSLTSCLFAKMTNFLRQAIVTPIKDVDALAKNPDFKSDDGRAFRIELPTILNRKTC